MRNCRTDPSRCNRISFQRLGLLIYSFLLFIIINLILFIFIYCLFVVYFCYYLLVYVSLTKRVPEDLVAVACRRGDEMCEVVVNDVF